MKVTRPNTLLTIDPGRSNGGLAFWKLRNPVKCMRMPAEIDGLKPYLKYIAETYPETVVFIERVTMFGSDQETPGKLYGIKKMLANYEAVKALLVLLNLRYVEVYPQSWQSNLKLNRDNKRLTSTEKKNKYKRYAINCFPEVPVTLWNSDALCILMFAFNKYANDKDYIAKNIKNQQEGLF